MNTSESNKSAPHQSAVVSVLSEQIPSLRFAYVFGSAARDALRPDSDYDVALEAADELDVEVLIHLSGVLESVVGRKVDVVDLRRAGPVLRMQILTAGHLVTCIDRRALAEFQMYTPAQYEDWKHLSRPLEQALIRRFQS